MRLLLATRNAGKLRELRELLSDGVATIVGLDQFPDSPEVEETGDTFVANALLKARSGAQISGLPTVADDSGLEVDVLDGRPGVRSARYGEPEASTDADRNQRLLAELATVSDGRRTARFRCAAVLVWPDKREPLIAEGVCEGFIARKPVGDMGFGYDPIFVSRDLGITFGETPLERKNQLSHRARAFKALVSALVDMSR